MGASLVLLLGRQILARIGILRTYSIPEPVVGGLLVAFLAFALRAVFQIDVRFDTTLQTPLMLTFFATIGLNADLAGLKAGGRSLIVFLGAVGGLMEKQDALGLVLAWALGQERLLGLLGASVTLSGGHGTGAAWARVFAERHGLASATEIAIACATFGLILGGLIGGPVARFLITRHSLVPNPESNAAGLSGFEQPKAVRPITAMAVIETVALIAVCLAVGSACSVAGRHGTRVTRVRVRLVRRRCSAQRPRLAWLVSGLRGRSVAAWECQPRTVSGDRADESAPGGPGLARAAALRDPDRAGDRHGCLRHLRHLP